jgi:hypothetical protein
MRAFTECVDQKREKYCVIRMHNQSIRGTAFCSHIIYSRNLLGGCISLCSWISLVFWWQKARLANNTATSSVNDLALHREKLSRSHVEGVLWGQVSNARHQQRSCPYKFASIIAHNAFIYIGIRSNTKQYIIIICRPATDRFLLDDLLAKSCERCR